MAPAKGCQIQKKGEKRTLNGDPVIQVISLFHWGVIGIFTGLTKDVAVVRDCGFAYEALASLHPE